METQSKSKYFEKSIVKNKCQTKEANGKNKKIINKSFFCGCDRPTSPVQNDVNLEDLMYNNQKEEASQLIFIT